jgi:enoyl-CoA hydratase
MTDDTVRYDCENGVATIRIDDGKRNALAPAVIRSLDAAFDRARSECATVVLTGRESVFSAGFDLNVMKRGGREAIGMLRGGYRLPAKVLAHPHPVIVACNGHSFAMGVFLMLAADHIIGCMGDYRISANEVAIGLPMPRVAAAMLEHRLNPAAYQRAVTLAAEFHPESALLAGFFDELVEPQHLDLRAAQVAEALKKLPPIAHGASKRRIRKALIRRLNRYVRRDVFDAAMMGLRGVKPG